MIDTPQNLPDKLICEIYRSAKKPGYYLYVIKQDGLSRVPEALLALFEKPEQSLVLLLTPTRKLAKEQALQVMQALVDKGYYLQLPPQTDDPEMLAIQSQNHKLGRA
jgi:uncharacterized protein